MHGKQFVGDLFQIHEVQRAALNESGAMNFQTHSSTT